MSDVIYFSAYRDPEFKAICRHLGMGDWTRWKMLSLETEISIQRRGNTVVGKPSVVFAQQPLPGGGDEENSVRLRVVQMIPNIVSAENPGGRVCEVEQVRCNAALAAQWHFDNMGERGVVEMWLNYMDGVTIALQDVMALSELNRKLIELFSACDRNPVYTVDTEDYANRPLGGQVGVPG